jgi:hypothetical protein
VKNSPFTPKPRAYLGASLTSSDSGINGDLKVLRS